jgi:hypothetical protein
MHTLRLGLLFALVLGLLAGCSGTSRPTAHVSGKITYKGETVKGGNIQFIGKGDAPPARATITKDGTYEIADAPVGDFLVSIETESMNPHKAGPTYGQAMAKKAKGPVMDPSKMAGDSGGGMMSPEEMAARYVKIPDKYNNPNKSGLTATFKPGRNTVDFPLKDD